jgi:glycosyltransferase involved in cell wall biosynthesis/O-antigen/teichoic acid export membrane protein
MVGGGILIMAALIANFSNFLYNAFLGRSVSLEEFGLVSLISSFFALTGVATAAIGRTVTHKSAWLYGKYGHPVKEFWARVRRQSFAISLGLALLWLLLIPLLMELFKADSPIPFVLFTPVWIVGLAAAADSGYLSGNLKFALIAGLVLVASSVKLVITYLLVKLGLTQWVYAAIPVSVVISFFLGWLAARRLKAKPLGEAATKAISFPKTFFGASVLTKLSSVAFLSFDVVLAKIYLSPIQAGEYALLSLAGKIIFFFGILFAQFINPVVSKREGEKKDSLGVFYKFLLATTLASGIGFVFIGLLGDITVPLLFGPKAQAIVPLLPVYAGGIAAFTVASSIVVYHQIKKQYLFPVVGFGLALVQVFGILLFHQTPASVALVVSFVGMGYLVTMLFLHIAYHKLVTVGRNIVDFLGIFARIPQPAVSKDKLRILVFNWRDTKHIWGGGAEVYIHELAKRWVAEGHRVTVFCGNDGKHKRNEVLEGVQIVRRGGFFMVYFWAFLYYILRFRGRYDVVIDCENGIPFFTPLYVRVPKFLLIHHVHQDIFLENLKAPLYWLAIFLESRLMPQVYRNCEVITVSKSSKKAIIRHRLTKKIPVVIPNGVDLKKYVPGKKAKMPLVLYLGRLKPYKNLPVLIKAFEQIIQKLPKVKLVIAGFGESRSELELLVRRLKLEKNIKFEGKVTERRKVRLYQQAWVSVNPSSMEGWSVTSIEANACATPIVASDVPGLRDSVRNPRSGFLVEYDNSQAFADCIFRIITSRRLREDLSISSRVWATQFRWEKSAKRFLSLFKDTHQPLTINH